MTNFDKIAILNKKEVAKIFCRFMGELGEDGCEACVASKYCYNGHNGMEEWLDEALDEQGFQWG